MTRIFTRQVRKATALVGAAGLALALAACSPPNENPSDIKIDTATEFRAPESEDETATSEAEATDPTGLGEPTDAAGVEGELAETQPAPAGVETVPVQPTFG